MNILVVDDEPEMVMIVSAILKKIGDIKVDSARDGGECLEKLKKRDYDLILLDVMMPGDDGWKICKKITSDDNTKHIPVVMFTVRTAAESRLKSVECGAVDQINKPFEMEEIITTVKKALGRPRR